jgi:3-hydroxybutyryl-CoA dehydrogenase
MLNVIIAGEIPLVEELTHRCVDTGHSTTAYLVEDFLSAVQSGYILGDLSEVDVAIEVHDESSAAKQELLQALSTAIPESALLLTSALATSTTQAAAWIMHPGRVSGFGIVPPLGKDTIVEIAAALQSDSNSIKRAEDFWDQIGFEAVKVEDGPGLVRGRIVCCLINEATHALMGGVASAEDIDLAMKLGTNYPYGPLEWADQIGLDTVLGVMTGLFNEWGEDRYRPSPLLRRMVLAGYLGKKSGRGFFEYR